MENDLRTGEIELGMHFAAPLGLAFHEVTNLRRIASIDGERITGWEKGVGAMNAKFVRHATLRADATDELGMIDDILCHAAVGRPLAACDGDETGVGDEDGVIPRKCGGASCFLRCHQRPQACEHAQHITRPRITREIAGGMCHEELDFIGQWAWFE